MTVDPIVITHEGYLEILITALGLIITVLAILLAVFGFVGYGSLKQSMNEAAERAADKAARAVAEDTFAKELDRRVNDLTKKAVAAALKTRRSLDQGKALSKEQFSDSHPPEQSTKRLPRTSRRAKKDSDLNGDSDGER